MITDIIFDWDGTLVNTLPFLEETFAKTFEYLGRTPLTYAQIRKVIYENPEQDMLQSVYGQRDLFAAKRFFHTYTLRNHLNNLEQMPYAQEVLDFCYENHIRCHLFSNKRNSILQNEVEYLGWNKYFCGIIGAGELTEDKPSAEACRGFLTKEQPQIQHTIVVGDGPADTEVGNFIGCPIAIIETKQAYIGQKPDYTFHNLQEFLLLLKTMLY